MASQQITVVTGAADALGFCSPGLCKPLWRFVFVDKGLGGFVRSTLVFSPITERLQGKPNSEARAVNLTPSCPRMLPIVIPWNERRTALLRTKAQPAQTSIRI